MSYIQLPTGRVEEAQIDFNICGARSKAHRHTHMLSLLVPLKKKASAREQGKECSLAPSVLSRVDVLVLLHVVERRDGVLVSV